MILSLSRERYRLSKDAHGQLKFWVWAYFFLLIFEGALRKWLLPGLADALLIVRDPLVIWLIAYAWYRKVFEPNAWVVCSWLIGMICFVATLLVGHGNIFVAVFGLRILLLHFPFIFVVASIFDRRDVVQIGRVLLLIAIPMTLLMAMQFYSPQSAWVNRGIAGSMEGGGFSGSMGYYRPPGTFSFTNGLVAFYSLLACYVWYFWFNRREIRQWLLLAATFCVICAIPLSIARALFFQILITSFFAFVYALSKPKSLVVFVAAGISILLFFIVLQGVPFFSTASEAFMQRFTSANESEGGAVEGVLGNRLLGSFIRGITGSGDVPFWGYGLGLGTGAGSAMLTGSRDFLVSEGEWGRVIGEMGIVFGLAFVMMRVGLVIKFLAGGYKMIRRGNPLPWLISSFAAYMVLTGQWAQPTMLGFSVMSAGLVLACLKKGSLEA